jgi:MoaA/NifB/PqqE/SkfB family radical SAM enzyme
MPRLEHGQRLQMYLRGELSPGPAEVHVDLTNACNLDCVTCWNYSPHLEAPRSAAWKRQRLDYELFARLVEDLAAMGVEQVLLSGSGEPFFHPRVYDMLALLKGRGLEASAITNGTVVDWDRLLALGVRRLLVNTSAASAASYVAFHPSQNAATWKKLRDGIAKVASRIQVHLVQVICATNWHEVPAMIDLAREDGAARVSFKLANLDGGTEAVAVSDAQRHRLLAELLPEAETRARRLGVSHNLDVLRSQLSGTAATRFPIEEVGCHVGHFYSRIYVDGRVFFCCEHIEVGRLDQAPFQEIWRSPRYDWMRERLAAPSYFPGCQRCGKYELNFRVHAAMRALGRSPARKAGPPLEERP